MYSALSTFNTTTEVPLSKAPNPQLLPGRRSINGCPLLRVCVHGVCVFTTVCVHFGWVKCRARIPSMGHHTWPYVTSLSLFTLISDRSLDFSELMKSLQIVLLSYSAQMFFVSSNAAQLSRRARPVWSFSCCLSHLPLLLPP